MAVIYCICVYECGMYPYAYVHVWGTHVSASVHAYKHEHVGVWGRCWESSSIALHLIHWGKVSQQNPELNKIPSGTASLLQGFPVCLSGVESQVGHHTWPVWRWVLGIQALVFTCGCFPCWDISLTLEGSFIIHVTVALSSCYGGRMSETLVTGARDSPGLVCFLVQPVLSPITGTVHPVDSLSAEENHC